MKAIRLSAFNALQRRMNKCFKSSREPNNMTDCGWTDTQNYAYSMSEYFKAVYRQEKVLTQMNRKGDL